MSVCLLACANFGRDALRLVARLLCVALIEDARILIRYSPGSPWLIFTRPKILWLELMDAPTLPVYGALRYEVS